MTNLLGRHLVNADIFTDAYRITGKAQVGSGGFIAELGNTNTDYLEVEEAYVSRILEPGKIIQSFTHGSFHKDNIIFVILTDRRDGLPAGKVPTTPLYSRGRPTEVFLTVPSFEISGQLLYDGKLPASSALVNSPGRFQSIYEAKAMASLYSEIAYNGDLILVSKSKIGLFCLGAPL